MNDGPRNVPCLERNRPPGGFYAPQRARHVRRNQPAGSGSEGTRGRLGGESLGGRGECCAPEQRETPSLARAGPRRRDLRARASLRALGNGLRGSLLGADTCAGKRASRRPPGADTCARKRASRRPPGAGACCPRVFCSLCGFAQRPLHCTSLPARSSLLSSRARVWPDHPYLGVCDLGRAAPRKHRLPPPSASPPVSLSGLGPERLRPSTDCPG